MFCPNGVNGSAALGAIYSPRAAGTSCTLQRGHGRGGGRTWGQPGDSEVGDGSVRNGAERGLGKEGSAGREVAVPWWGRSFMGKHP